MEFITKIIEDNDFVSGGLVLILVGAVLAYLRSLPSQIFDFIKRRFTYQVEVWSIASEMKSNIATLNLASSDLNDTKLISYLASIPKNSILMIEDIDALFEQRESKAKDSKITFSGLLNALDGVASSEGRTMFVTTNYIDSLDSALIRPGRIDKLVEVAYPNRDIVERMFLKFFPGQNKLASKFANRVKPETSAAQLQEHFLQNKTAEEAVRTMPPRLEVAQVVKTLQLGGNDDREMDAATSAGNTDQRN